MANIPIPENDDSLELNVRYQPDMVLEGMLDATVPEFTKLTLTKGSDVYDLAGGGSSLPDIGENDEGKVLMVVEEDDELVPAWGSAALPEITEQDMGKVLAAGEGEPVWAEPSGGVFNVTLTATGNTVTANASYTDVINAIQAEQVVIFTLILPTGSTLLYCGGYHQTSQACGVVAFCSSMLWGTTGQMFDIMLGATNATDMLSGTLPE